MNLLKRNKPAKVVLIALLVAAYGWTLYALLGPHIGRRGVVYVEAGTIFLVLTYLKGIHLLVKSAVFACSLFLSSVLLFSFFEIFPRLIPIFHLDIFGYYSSRVDYIPDPILRKRNRPSFARTISSYRGSDYSPLYRIDVSPTTIEWSIDADGFRNSRIASHADIAFIGDSMLDVGDTETDTVTKRLERLSGLTVRNLGTSAYGPDQYLEVLKQYGVKLRPRYALFAFDEGNDMIDVIEFERWKTGDPERYLDPSLSNSYWRRYKAAMRGIFGYVENTVFTAALLAYQNFLGDDAQVHPDIAVLNLRGRYFYKLFGSGYPPRPAASIEEMLSSHAWQRLREILIEFKSVCIGNRITPIIVLIPSDVHIYAEYSTPDSGENWLKYRAQQLALTGTVEQPLTKLAKEVGIDLISITPAFEAAAKEGKMLFYPLDSHWNAEGREIAAAFVAEALRKRADFHPRIGPVPGINKIKKTQIPDHLSRLFHGVA